MFVLADVVLICGMGLLVGLVEPLGIRLLRDGIFEISLGAKDLRAKDLVSVLAVNSEGSIVFLACGIALCVGTIDFLSIDLFAAVLVVISDGTIVCLVSDLVTPVVTVIPDDTIVFLDSVLVTPDFTVIPDGTIVFLDSVLVTVLAAISDGTIVLLASSLFFDAVARVESDGARVFLVKLLVACGATDFLDDSVFLAMLLSIWFMRDSVFGTVFTVLSPASGGSVLLLTSDKISGMLDGGFDGERSFFVFGTSLELSGTLKSGLSLV